VPTDRSNPTVIVFRKRLLAYSETFIAGQGHALPSYEACFAGFRVDRSGLALLGSSRVLLQQDHSGVPALSRLRLRLGAGVNRRWLEALDACRPRLLHAHFGPDGLAALPIAERLGIPLVVTFHGFDITQDRPSTAGYRRGRPELFVKAAKIIAVSKYIRGKLIERGCPEDKIVHHRIGIDLERFRGDKRETPEPTILFVGRLVEKKGCIYLLEAARSLKEKFPTLRILIAGTGPLSEELDRFGRSHGLNVELLGSQPVDRVRGLLQSGWILCVPSIVARSGDAEGLGMVFLEAQALGTPVVSFATGGVPEAVAHGKTGLLAPERDVPTLAAYLGELLSDDAARREYGRRGIERVRELFDIRRQCAALEEIYDAAASISLPRAP
jgi:glycosyltransferase involved in cell wall biosynthesis